MLLAQLTRPQAFPYKLPSSERVTVIQTHASLVLLAGPRVYKLKKARNFGFFDYSTPAQRRHFCSQEVILNARLAPQVYQGVAPVLASPRNTLRFGPTLSLNQLPDPGAPFANGRVVDYAVVMQRLPEESTLAAQVAAGTATPELLAAIAEPLARFHASTHTTKYSADFGSLRVIRHNWEENFRQIRPFVGRSLDHASFERILNYIGEFLTGYAALFNTRIREGHIRDCHGDLRLQHVYTLAQPQEGAPAIVMVDCIEFNDRFRYSDVAAEVAFLVMELDAARRSDLARAFVEAYVHLTSDQALYELLPFYACYRACVRGKVLSFLLDEPEVPAEQRETARQEAARLFTLAAEYASASTRPTLLLVGGLMGTGKSMLAHQLHDELGWPLISSDTTRKRLAGLEAAQPQMEAFGEGLYAPAQKARVYQEMLNQAVTQLSAGRSVILDATFAQRAYRHAAAQEASLHGANLVFLECHAPRDLTLQRLAVRWQARLAQQPDISSAESDARPELYDAQAEEWQPFYADEEPLCEYLAVSTASTPDLDPILNALSIPPILRSQ